MRALILSTLFPSRARPTLGVFVERQALALAEQGEVEPVLVSGIGLPAWPLSLHRRWAELRGLPVEEDWKGLRVLRPRYRAWPILGQRLAAAALAEAALPLAERLKPDVIHADYFWPDGPAAMRLARSLGVPFSVKARGSDIYHWADRPGIREQIKEAADAAAGLLAVSEGLKGEMVARGLPGWKIRVHHTGVDRERFRPADREAAKAALGLSGPVLVTPGALIPRKGQALAIEAVAMIEGATLLLVGDGPDRAMLGRLARRLGVEQRVRFLGNRPHEELPAILAAADVTLSPSSAEGLANVWVESLACGTPVVTTDVGGAREAIDRPAAGRIVAREPEALAAAVRGLLSSPPPVEAVRAAGARFGWDRNAAELADHLKGIAAAAASSRLAVGGPGDVGRLGGGADSGLGGRLAAGGIGAG